MVATTVLPGVVDTLFEFHVPEIPASLLTWKGRDECLKRVFRYHRLPFMMYRTTLYEHYGPRGRVPAFVEEAIPLALEYFENFDPKLALLRARHHDDHEIAPFIGDVPT